MRRGERLGTTRVPRGVHARAVAEERRTPRLVQRRPRRHAVAECGGHDARVVSEVQCGIAVRPTALVLQDLRQVPVVEGQDGRDPGFEERVDEA